MTVDNLLEIQQDSPLGSCQIVSVLTSQAVPLTTPSTSIYDSLPFQSTQEVATARDGLLSSPSGMLDAGWRKALDTMIKPDWGGSHGGLDGVTRRLRRARLVARRGGSYLGESGIGRKCVNPELGNRVYETDEAGLRDSVCMFATS